MSGDLGQSAENDAEPRQQYVDPEGTCWSVRCQRPVTHLLTTRAAPDAAFPQGLLVEAGYCWEDAIWFAGKVVATEKGEFVSLTETRVTPPGGSDA